MRACQIMTPRLVTVPADALIAEAAELMLRKRISGLPVVDVAGWLVGIVSEGDFIRRSEIGRRGDTPARPVLAAPTTKLFRARAHRAALIDARRQSEPTAQTPTLPRVQATKVYRNLTGRIDVQRRR